MTKNGRVLDLASWVGESLRRGEEVDVCLLNRSTMELVSVSTNPEFIAGIARTSRVEKIILESDAST